MDKVNCMKVTFLIGNGFDIGMGMRSKFSDYFPIYIAQSKNKKISLKGLADHIAQNEDNWSYFERQLGHYTNEFMLETKKVFVDQVKDFEKGFMVYLKGQEKKLSFENNQKIAHRMIDALLTFYSDNNLPRQSAQDISKIYSLFSKESITYNFINFNYTSVLKKCMDTIPQNIVCKRKISNNEYVDKIGQIVHVHGYSDKYPIMGVNDASQISNKELATDDRFVRYIVKPVINQRLRQNNDTDADKLIAESTIICIYGMSLGETDKQWWNKILAWLHNNTNRQLIIFEYDEQFTMTTQFDRIEKEDAILDKLAEYNNNSIIAVEKLRSRIHIAVHKNIFQMNLRKKTEEKNNATLEQVALGNIARHGEELARGYQAAEKAMELLNK